MPTDTSVLDQWFPPCGPCGICGYKDKRHRIWDAIIDLQETDEMTASVYEYPVEAVRAVRAIWKGCDE